MKRRWFETESTDITCFFKRLVFFQSLSSFVIPQRKKEKDRQRKNEKEREINRERNMVQCPWATEFRFFSPMYRLFSLVYSFRASAPVCMRACVYEIFHRVVNPFAAYLLRNEVTPRRKFPRRDDVSPLRFRVFRENYKLPF